MYFVMNSKQNVSLFSQNYGHLLASGEGESGLGTSEPLSQLLFQFYAFFGNKCKNNWFGLAPYGLRNSRSATLDQSELGDLPAGCIWNKTCIWRNINQRKSDYTQVQVYWKLYSNSNGADTAYICRQKSIWKSFSRNYTSYSTVNKLNLTGWTACIG